MKNKLSISEIVKSKIQAENNPLNEFSLVNKPEDSLSSNQYKVYVYGNDRNPMTPHFHFFDKTEDLFHVEIQIEGVNKEIKILNYKFKPNQKELNKAIPCLESWIKTDSKRIKSHTNYEALIVLWNANNPDNELEF